ncbi:hypothetical protein LEQ06_19135 [Paraclostridium sp. AKS46]|nr:hypothetical protein [Paraclostridium sp. AKS46]
MKKLKKMTVLSLATALLIVPMTSNSFADSSTFISDEGIGIEVYNPNFVSDEGIEVDMSNPSFVSNLKYASSPRASVGGGTLWPEWNGGSTFRAHYAHNSKEHRSSATNDLGGTPTRSKWVAKGKTATSPWLIQTVSNNKVWGATR